MRDPENIRRIDLSGADWMGFVFYPPSPRRVESLPAFMPEYARRVGVFVDEPVENIQVRAKEFGLDYLQLHGTPCYQSVPDRDGGRPRSDRRLRSRLFLLPFRYENPGLRRFRKNFRLDGTRRLPRPNAVPAQRRHRPGTRPGFEGVPSRPAGRIRPKQPIRTGSGYQRRRKNNAIYSGYEM